MRQETDDKIGKSILLMAKYISLLILLIIFLFFAKCSYDLLLTEDICFTVVNEDIEHPTEIIFQSNSVYIKGKKDKIGFKTIWQGVIEDKPYYFSCHAHSYEFPQTDNFDKVKLIVKKIHDNKILEFEYNYHYIGDNGNVFVIKANEIEFKTENHTIGGSMKANLYQPKIKYFDKNQNYDIFGDLLKQDY